MSRGNQLLNYSEGGEYLFCFYIYKTYLLETLNHSYIRRSIIFKILVPIDGSEPSFHTARVDINIANKFNSKIIVLYVVVSPSKNEYANLTGFVTPKQIELI